MGNGESTTFPSCGRSPSVENGTEVIGHGSRAPKSDREIEDWLQGVKKSAKLDCETIGTRFNRYIKELSLSKETMDNIVEDFIDELQIGLECHKKHPDLYVPKECSFKMLDSCVQGIPSGTESGVFYALDMGGTNFRVVRCQMKDGKIKESQCKASLASGGKGLAKGLLDGNATASSMFDFFAETVKKFMIEEGDINSSSQIPCGFTFSFPCTLRKIDSANLIVWTKGFETGRNTSDPVEGVDVAELMNLAFRRQGVPMVINSVANDTVGTLLSCAYTLDTRQKPPCLIGLILGTGFNACYFEEHAKAFGYMGSIVNIESGNFNRIPRISVDHAVDFSDVGGRGKQHLEKMVAGAYLGELARCAIVKVLQENAPALAHRPASLTSEDASAIIGDKSSSLVVVQRVVFEKWETDMSFEYLQMIQALCSAVFERSAALSACVIVGCAKKTNHLQEARGGLTVGIDGSLYKCNAFYRENVRSYLKILLKDQAALVHLELADDGSGRGAGILAALVDSTSSSLADLKHEYANLRSGSSSMRQVEGGMSERAH